MECEVRPILTQAIRAALPLNSYGTFVRSGGVPFLQRLWLSRSFVVGPAQEL